MRLKQVQFIEDFQDDIGYLADPVAPVPFHATEVDVRKVVRCAAFFGGHADFWRGGMVVELDPETAEQFFGFLPVNCPAGKPFFIKRAGVLKWSKKR